MFIFFQEMDAGLVGCHCHKGKDAHLLLTILFLFFVLSFFDFRMFRCLFDVQVSVVLDQLVATVIKERTVSPPN